MNNILDGEVHSVLVTPYFYWLVNPVTTNTGLDQYTVKEHWPCRNFFLVSSDRHFFLSAWVVLKVSITRWSKYGRIFYFWYTSVTIIWCFLKVYACSFFYFLSFRFDVIFFPSSQKKSGCAYQLFGALIVEPLCLFLFINQTHCTAIMKADRYIKRLRCYTFTLCLCQHEVATCQSIMYLEVSCCPIGTYSLIYQNSLCFSSDPCYTWNILWSCLVPKTEKFSEL
jgi:hypothetical protein